MTENLSPHERLTALLKSHIEPLVKHRLKMERKNMPLRERFWITAVFLWFNLVIKYEWIKKWAKDENFRSNPPPFRFKEPDAENEQYYDWEVHKTLQIIVSFWMQSLALSARDSGKLVLSELNDAMLPEKLPACVTNENVAWLLEEQCAGLVIDAKDVRNVLWAIRQSHCCVEVLPEAMKEYLASAGITVE